MILKKRNEEFSGKVKNYLDTATGKLLSHCKSQNLALRALRKDFTIQELDLMEAAIKKPDEHFQITKLEDLGEVGFAIAAMNDQQYVVESKESIKRRKDEIALIEKNERASKEWSKYSMSEQYLINSELVSMDHKERRKMELQATLIGRAIRGESITNNQVKDYQEFFDKA